MIKRTSLIASFLVASAVSGLAFAGAAMAAETKPYSAAALQAAQDAGKPVIVDVSATWCPTCKAQKPIVAAIVADPKFKDLLILDMDFDSQKADVHKLDVRAQSTFVAFKGKQEVGRSTGDTNKASIEKLFEKTS